MFIININNINNYYYFFLYLLFYEKYFQKELPLKHEVDHEGILNKAFAVKYNQKKMKK